nr:uncharacterized protein I303_08296 [Kwoniella dejecticola CBS 10117]OBR81526.1 hypothetical protein I303_08296 [Kwoniella dejecticola CBS 10117]
MVEPLAGRNAFGCRCNNAYTIQGTDGNGVGACDSYTWFTYVHSQEAAATGWSKRQQKARLAEKRRREQALCPSHLTACTIPQTASYECIDTGSELESCGGCMHGEHGRLNSTAGMDCSTLPGVAFGAVTCYDSRCEAFACKAGYRLVGDFCVPV